MSYRTKSIGNHLRYLHLDSHDAIFILLRCISKIDSFHTRRLIVYGEATLLFIHLFEVGQTNLDDLTDKYADKDHVVQHVKNDEEYRLVVTLWSFVDCTDTYVKSHIVVKLDAIQVYKAAEEIIPIVEAVLWLCLLTHTLHVVWCGAVDIASKNITSDVSSNEVVE